MAMDWAIGRHTHRQAKCVATGDNVKAEQYRLCGLYEYLTERSPTAETEDLKSFQCGFESRRSDHRNR